MRLIDADKLLEAGDAVKISCEKDESPNIAIGRQGAMFKKLVQDAPTVDAVPVVRCKDCKHYTLQRVGCPFAPCTISQCQAKTSAPTGKGGIPMYEPVATFVQGKTESFIEGELLRVTQEMGLDVSREELLKALQYDRGQYEKGYRDGCRDSRKDGRWEYHGGDDDMGLYGFCSNCQANWDEEVVEKFKFCPNCGAMMDGGETNGT